MTTTFFNNRGFNLTLKLVLIAALILLLLIPRFMIEDLIHDREKLSQSVIKEVSAGWGGNQTLAGPFLVIPYFKQDTSKQKVKSYLIIQPSKLKIDGGVTTTSKFRSIYEVILYQSKLKMTGTIDIDKIQQSNIPSQQLLLNEAFIAIGIQDLKGIQNNPIINWNNNTYPMKAGINNISFSYSQQQQNEMHTDFASASRTYVENKLMNSGISSNVAITLDKKSYDFNLDIELKGSQNLDFSPLASNTEIAINSNFKDPSFNGKFLPDNKVDNKGFNATWKILEYNRSIPAFTTETSEINIEDNLFGVRLSTSISNYVKTNRAIKYMILIVALTFLVVFITETIERRKVHIFQYTLIGLALAIFYTLLLAFSEIVSFDISYLISAVATIALLYLYSLSLFKSKKSSLLLLALSVMIYSYIYSIIRLEKTALLFGAIGLFIVLAATMYATRKINWYENKEDEESNHDLTNQNISGNEIQE